jgi:hypothetical protein
VDNFANQVTHGLTMIASEVFVESSQIYNTEAFLDELWAKNLDKVDTGFFNLYLSSQLHISNQTEIRRITAQKQSVLNAVSQSSVFTSDGVSIIDCQA